MAADRENVMAKPYKLRFRHLEGDLGPFQFQENTTVLAMKNQIWDEWPSEGPLCDKVCILMYEA